MLSLFYAWQETLRAMLEVVFSSKVQKIAKVPFIRIRIRLSYS